MAIVHLPSTLRGLAAGTDRLDVGGESAGEVLRRLEREHPRLRGWVLDEQGRLREHVTLFVNEERADLTVAVGAADRLYVVQAISGGALAEPSRGDVSVELPDLGRMIQLAELLVGTKKGLFVLHGKRGGAMEVGVRAFAGQVVEYAVFDPRSELYFAAVTHGQFGPRLFFTDDPAGDWEQAEGPVFPADTGAAVTRIWSIEPGEEAGVVWAGVALAALFKSTDDGRTWSLNRSLWNQPGRPEWQAGAGGLCLHSIAPWPRDPARLAVRISAAGVWRTEDSDESWR